MLNIILIGMAITILVYRYRKLMTADSKGVYFARMIGGRFPYVRINDEFPFPNEKN